ncbi:MAG: hypothetical protein ACSHXF_10520 [Aquaticitalea sp.]
MKTVLTLFLVVMTTFSYAQYPNTITTTDRVDAMANNLTDSYNKELVLTSVQIPLFKNVVEKYIIASEKATEQLDGREELNALVELQAKETLEMSEILTQNQLRLYKKVKYDLQPLKSIDTKD